MYNYLSCVPVDGLIVEELSVLAFSFFAAIFSSLLWLIYSLAYISDNTVGIKFSALGIVDVSIYTALVVLPILVLWLVFGYISQYLNMRNLNRNLFQLFKQMKKNQDYTDLIARIMLESEQQIKDGFILNRIDILIADMNELIAEMISRAALASHEQIETLWSKVRNGGKWALGKVIIEISQNQPNFQMRIYEKSQRDLVLAGTILEFCARYQNILTLLEKHDKERVFLNVVETGVFGKVYSILAPIADEIRRHRDVTAMNDKEETREFHAPDHDRQPARPIPAYQPRQEEKKNPLLAGISKLGSILKKDKQPSRNETVAARERDPFSMALERSFGTDDEPELTAHPEPRFEISEPMLEATEEEPQLRVETPEPRFDEPHFESESVQENAAPEIILPQQDEPVIEEERAEIVIGHEEEDKNIPPLIIREESRPEPKIEPKAEPKAEEAPITSTQKTLNELRKEWEDMRRASQEPEPKGADKNEDYAYPFGGWTDESNYNK